MDFIRRELPGTLTILLSGEISQAKIEMIIKGFKSGISIELLTNISGISIEEISSLLKKNNLL